MPVAVTHQFVSPVADEGDPNKAGPNEWNAEHTIVGLGTAAEADSTDFATAAQGAKADTAVQPAAIANMLETGDIGVLVQAYSANLDEYAAVNPTAAGLSLLDDANAAAQLVTLGLTATAAELNFTEGVTSAIQTQLDGKQPLNASLTAANGKLSANVQSSGRFGLDNTGGLFSYQDILAAGADGVGVAARTQATFDYTGGTPGDVYSASWVSAEATAGVADYVWSFLSVLNNSATAGENVAGYFQGNKQSGAGPTWSACIDTKDFNAADPTSGVIGIEAAIFANGTDANGVRVIADIVGGKNNAGGSDATISYGVRVGTSAGATISSGVRVEDAITNGLSISNTGSRGIKYEATSSLAVGADFSAATFSAAAIRLAGGQYLAFDASDTGRLSYSSGALRYAFSGDEVFNLTDAGALTIDGGLTSGAITASSASTNVLAALTYTNDGAGFGPQVRYIRESTTPAASDGLGGFQFLGRSSTAAQITYADVLASIVSPTNGATQGQLQFRTDTNGSAAARLTIQVGVTIGAPGSGDMGSGTLNMDNALYRDGLQVVGARQTGWTAATGTATRTTFATGSVTLPQLAERVKALVDDLISHGLIGT